MEPIIRSRFLPDLIKDGQFRPESRLWIYVAERPLTDMECAVAESALQNFTESWTAHQQALKAGAEIWNRQFIFLVVDESQAGASGCSIDKSVHFLEQLSSQLQIDFFDRMRFAWIEADGGVNIHQLNMLPSLVQSGAIQPSTLMVNTLVKTLGELEQNWLVPFNESWQVRFA